MIPASSADAPPAPAYRIGVLPADPVARRPLLPEIRALRARAYAAHRPEVVPHLLAPDPVDEAPDTLILVARDPAGRAVGTMRLASRSDGPLPLEAEPDLDPPPGLLGPGWFEAARFCVDRDFRPAGAVPVGPMLIKATYRVLVALGGRGVLVVSRGPMAERFADIGFRELEPGRTIRLRQLGGLEHRVFVWRLGVDDVATTAAGHPFAVFVHDVENPEIDLSRLERETFSATMEG